MTGMPSSSMIHWWRGLVERLAGEEQVLERGQVVLLRKAGSCFLSTRTAVGAENITVTLYFSTICHQMPASGRSGVPLVHDRGHARRAAGRR